MKKQIARRDFLKVLLTGIGAFLASCMPRLNQTPAPESETTATSVSGESGSLSLNGNADVIYTDGVILTMDAKNSIVEAIAIRGNRIVAVGTNDEVRRYRAEKTVLIGLGGHTLMPGFVDAHAHLGAATQGKPDAFKQIHDDAIQNGITTETEMGVTPDLLDQFKGYDQAGLMRIRWNLYLLYNTNCGERFDTDWYKTYKQGEQITPHLRNQGVKVFSDGGSCHVPAVTFTYSGGYGHGDLYMSQDELTAVVRQVQDSGHQIAIHALGDRAIEEAQNAIAAALNSKPNTYRHRIEHNAVLHDDLLPRYNQIGVIPIIFGSYPTCWRVNPTSQFKYIVPENLGTWEWPWRALLDANPGVKAAWHSDYAVFPNIHPMVHLYGFVTRNQVAPDGSICQAPDWLKQGAITVDEALHIMTINSAYALLSENEIGSLEPGKLADMIILSDNPLRVEPERIQDIQVLITMIDGKVEHCAAGAEALCPSASAVNSNAAPIGFIDIPAANETVSGRIEIAGWALDNVKMDRVEIYVDGQYVGNAIYGNPRPDVDHDYPGRPGAPNFGFRYNLDTTSYSNGSHAIEALAINSAGNKNPLTPEKLIITVKNDTVNLALSAAVTASASLPDHGPSAAIDGSADTWWSAGSGPEQWIQIDLGKPTTVNGIRLVVSQYPEGETDHQLWAGPDANNLTLVHEFKGLTKDPDTLEFKPSTPLTNIRIIKVVTTQSPSWVAWREIEVTGQ